MYFFVIITVYAGVTLCIFSLNLAHTNDFVPREKFVPDALQEISYVDEDIQLSRNRFMMKPMILARLFQSLNLKGNENILHVGSNSGYGSAILSRMCSSVISLDLYAGRQ